MKLVASVVVLSLGHVVNGQWNPNIGECNDCISAADDLKKCVDSYCVDTGDEACLAAPPYLTMVDIADCCRFTSRAEAYCTVAARKVDTCIDSCLPTCVEETIVDYMECANFRSSNEDCSISDCITKIALEKEWVGDELNDEEKFFEKLQDSLVVQGQDESLECDNNEAKATSVCEIGQNCCDNCNPYLGDVIDCIVNEVVRPWQFSYFGETFDSDNDCEADCDRLTRRGRRLLDDTTTTSYTGDAEEDKALRAKAQLAAKPCLDGMKNSVALSGNMSNIGGETMNCVVVEGARTLSTEDGATQENEKKESSAKSAAAASIASALLAAAAAAVV